MCENKARGNVGMSSCLMDAPGLSCCPVFFDEHTKLRRVHIYLLTALSKS